MSEVFRQEPFLRQLKNQKQIVLEEISDLSNQLMGNKITEEEFKVLLGKKETELKLLGQRVRQLEKERQNAMQAEMEKIKSQVGEKGGETLQEGIPLPEKPSSPWEAAQRRFWGLYDWALEKMEQGRNPVQPGLATVLDQKRKILEEIQAASKDYLKREISEDQYKAYLKVQQERLDLLDRQLGEAKKKEELDEMVDELQKTI